VRRDGKNCRKAYRARGDSRPDRDDAPSPRRDPYQRRFAPFSPPFLRLRSSRGCAVLAVALFLRLRSFRGCGVLPPLFLRLRRSASARLAAAANVAI